jgi:phenylpropionate dioxygenase-like ring-hydroxylating dioxygenase large terminal subunit
MSEEKTSRSIKNLRHHWYPISFSKDLLVGDDPVSLHLLGDPIVLYRDPMSKKPVVLADVCPHRSAPLSLGKVVDGRLECKYHGWQFGADGKVQHIPALLPDKSIPPQARTKCYPVVETQSMIWVWPGPEAMADPGLIPDLRLTEHEGLPIKASSEEAMDLDVDFTLMVENLLDPAHLPFTHDGTISRRGRQCPLSAEMEVDSETDAIKTTFTQFLKGKKPRLINAAFYPPCTVVLNNTVTEGGWKVLNRMHCIPTRPGHMRLLFVLKRNFLLFLDHLPPVQSHFHGFIHKTVFQDYELLHGQSIRLKQGANAWQNPIQVDLPPKKFRSWIMIALKESSMQVWFKGYSADIEDIVSSNSKNNPCFASACDMYSALDEPHLVPKQRGVDNRAYTNPKEVLRIVNPKKSNHSLWMIIVLILVTLFGIMYSGHLVPTEVRLTISSATSIIAFFGVSWIVYKVMILH